jgi:hypothetical protein
MALPMTKRDVIKDLIQKEINDALECAAQAVYDSKYAWTQHDCTLLDAAERVRALKVPLVDAENGRKE